MKLNKKTLVTALTFLLIGIIGTSIVWVYASPLSTFTISGGVYPSADSYTVWGEGSTCYAKNAYGRIDYSGTNQSEVINDATEATYQLGGGDVLLKGDFLIDHRLLIKGNVFVRGEGTTATNIRLADGANDVMVEFVTSPIQGLCGLRDLRLEGRADYQTVEKVALWISGQADVTVKNIWIFDVYGIGLQINHGWGHRFEDVWIENCTSWGAKIFNLDTITIGDVRCDRLTVARNFEGIWAQGITTRLWITDSIFGDNEGTAIYLNNTETTIITDSMFTSNGWGTDDYSSVIAIQPDSGTVTEDILIQGNFFDGYHSYSGNYSRQAISTTYDVARLTVEGNVIRRMGTTGIYSRANYTTIVDNIIESCGSQIDVSGTNLEVHNNVGYNTENLGVATISGSTSVVVNHGLVTTPTSVTVTLGTTGAGDYYVNTLTTTQFTVHVANSGTYTVYWEAEYQP